MSPIFFVLMAYSTYPPFRNKSWKNSYCFWKPIDFYEAPGFFAFCLIEIKFSQISSYTEIREMVGFIVLATFIVLCALKFLGSSPKIKRLFPKYGWVGRLIPKPGPNPPNHPKKFLFFFTRISPFVFPNLTKTMWWVSGFHRFGKTFPKQKRFYILGASLKSSC